jgi:integrase
MGELRTRKRGKTWEYSFEGARINGKRNPISKGGFRTKADALAAGTQAKAEYDNTGRAFRPADLSLADYMDYWYTNYVLKNLSYNTQADYERKIRIHIKPALGIYRLSSIEPDAIQRWIDSKKEDGYSQNMVKNILSCLSAALDYAVYPCKYIKGNPCHYVRIPKIKDDPTRKAHTEYICSIEDFDAIIKRFGPESSFYIPLMTGYHCGTRIGETYGFDLLQDVDFAAHTISIRHQLKKEHGVWCYRAPKYDSCRTIRIDTELENMLKHEIRERQKNMLRYGQYFTKTYLTPDGIITQARADVRLPYQEIMPISVKENGELLTPESFKYCARVIHEELGNPNFHSHCLRHTHGTILAENGAQPKTVMERLGHKDVKTTMERYIFNTDKMQDDAVAIFVAATHKTCLPLYTTVGKR